MTSPNLDMTNDAAADCSTDSDHLFNLELKFILINGMSRSNSPSERAGSSVWSLSHSPGSMAHAKQDYSRLDVLEHLLWFVLTCKCIQDGLANNSHAALY